MFVKSTSKSAVLSQTYSPCSGQVLNHGDIVRFYDCAKGVEREGIVTGFVDREKSGCAFDPRVMFFVGTSKNAHYDQSVKTITPMTPEIKAALDAKQAEGKELKQQIVAKFNPYANLPSVVRITQFEDCGPVLDCMDKPGYCPHCGAEGRYIVHFLATDGQEYAAMRGCFAKWPKSPNYKPGSYGSKRTRR